MVLESLANVGEFVGGLGVVLSLIYVAVQIRHNTASRRMETYARTLEQMSALQHQLAKDHEFTRMYNIGLLDIYALGQTDRVRFVWVLTQFFGALEFMHYQEQEGNLPDELWQRWVNTTRWWLTFPGVIEWWNTMPTPFTDRFTAFVEDCIEQGWEVPNAEGWEALLFAPPVGREPRS